MDADSRAVFAFLESLQDAMYRLGEIQGHYALRGTRPERPFLVLSGRPFSIHEKESARQFHGSVALGILLRAADGREYQLGVDVLWDSERWTITTEAWVEADDGGQHLLRELPARSPADLNACRQQLKEAVEDLLRFEDLVPGGADSPGR